MRNRIRYLINHFRITLAYWLLPPSDVEHICDKDHWAQRWACPDCGRAICHAFGATDSRDCDDCWASKQEEDEHDRAA